MRLYVSRFGFGLILFQNARPRESAGPRAMQPGFFRKAVVPLLTVLCLFSGVACRPIQKDPAQSAPPEDAVPTPPSHDENVRVIYPTVPGSFVATTRKVKPSVVNIFTAAVVRDGEVDVEDFLRGSGDD